MRHKNLLFSSFAAILFLAFATILVLTLLEGPQLNPFTLSLLLTLVILVPAKLSNVVEKWGLPGVIGELLIGIVLGNLSLVGIHFFEQIPHNHVIEFLAQLGVLILLFQVGLDSNFNEVGKVGVRAFLVAISGILFTFCIGAFVIGPLLLLDLSLASHLFLGAALTTTSVGITARVLKDLKALNSKEGRIIIWSAVLDDILGLVLLATVSALFTLGTVDIASISWIVLKALLFLAASVVCGSLLTLEINLLFSQVSNHFGMRFTLAMIIAMGFAFIAHLLGLAPIIGAFAAGLILKSVYFKHFKDSDTIEDIKKHFGCAPAQIRKQLDKDIKKHEQRHIEELVEPLGEFLTPIFFVLTGFAVDLSALDTRTILLGLILALVAIGGKILSGIFAGRRNKWIVGWGMVPRGEVALIFASAGLAIGALPSFVFTALIVMMITTTIITPPTLSYLIRKKKTNTNLY